ncbi:MAG: DUF3467 domain-containing protein [Chloroflexi bacterium]|nr:DUF3467 domain-containing protein [Chloroflexota bacterium]
MSDQSSRAAYANQVQISGSPYDFTIDFACVEDVRNNTASVQPVARIMMSPQHTKVLALMLLKHVAAYEHAIGVIELPTALLNDMKLGNLEHFISQVNLNE